MCIYNIYIYTYTHVFFSRGTSPPKNHQHLLLQFVTLRGLDEEALGDGGRCTGTWENRPPISHMGWIINRYTIQWLSNDYPEIDGIWTFENIPMLIRFLKRLQYILLQGDHMDMDQYLLIPFLMGWIHKSQLFWCEQKGYCWFWHTAIYGKHPIIDSWLVVLSKTPLKNMS